MKLPLSISEKLILLQNGEKIPFSKMKHSVIEGMIDNGILKIHTKGRSKRLIYVASQNLLAPYLKNHFGIDNLEKYVEGYQRTDLSRAESIEISSNSKLRSIRTFKGFLLNCFQPVECILNAEPFILEPREGTFTFIYDYEGFRPAVNTTIVGIENPENFRYIQKQRKFFENIQPLFVSRYPQNGDLVKWLVSIPNDYLHFGDFDFAGLNIYWNEYKKHLQGKAQFFIPANIEEFVSNYGNRENYNKQTIQFDRKKVDEQNILTLLLIIEKYKKGLEQEILLTNSSLSII